jgi:inorganic triphosphatase YgiF
MGWEVELKFRASPASWARLAEVTTTRAGTLGPAVARRLDSTYFDTADGALARHGIVARIRAENDRRLFTIKTAADARDGPSVRREWNFETTGDKPDVALIARHVPGAPPVGALAPVYRTRIARVTRRLEPHPGVAIEVAFDAGVVSAKRRRARVREIEMELVEGRPHDLFVAALALHHELGPLRLQTVTKSERGHALARGTPLPPVHAGTLVLDPDQASEDACKAILRSCLGQIVANQAPAHAGVDSEGVHQMRVGVRRLRAALDGLARLLPRKRRRTLRMEFRWLARELGPARDWDVFIEERLASSLAAEALAPHAVLLRDRAAAERAKAYRRARRAIGAPRYTTMLLDAIAWLDEPWGPTVKPRRRARLRRPIGEAAWRLLRNIDRLVRQAKVPIAEADAATLHTVRIAAKKARYTVECLANLAPADAVGPYVKALKSVQEAFGQSNDAAHALVMIGRLTAGLPDDTAKTVAAALVDANGEPDLREKLRKTWRAFCDVAPIHRVLAQVAAASKSAGTT